MLGLVVLSLGGAGQARAQADAEARAERPVYQVIAGIAPDARINLRAGPANLYPAVATVRYGDRVQRLGCQNTAGVRWCRVRTDRGGGASGWIAARFLADARPPGGEPEFWAVRGLPQGDRLNVRAQPSGNARVLATLREGEVVRNLGCRTSGQSRWCRIRSLAGVDVTGWVNGRFLRESGRPWPWPGGGETGAGAGVWVVVDLPAGVRLNLRARPSAQAAVLAELREGTRVGNLGCERADGERWCLVRTLAGREVTGWVRSRFLRERN